MKGELSISDIAFKEGDQEGVVDEYELSFMIANGAHAPVIDVLLK